MKQFVRFIFFLFLNFGALALGSYWMGGSPAENTWYIALEKAPWTPPGYFFGIAWTTIMVLFTVFLYRSATPKPTFLALLLAHYVFNIGWNPVFFKWHWLLTGCVVIALLFVTVTSFLFIVPKTEKKVSFLLLFPYLAWLCVAFSLNLYPLV